MLAVELARVRAPGAVGSDKADFDTSLQKILICYEGASAASTIVYYWSFISKVSDRLLKSDSFWYCGLSDVMMIVIL